jgi:hypothetical protein
MNAGNTMRSEKSRCMTHIIFFLFFFIILLIFSVLIPYFKQGNGVKEEYLRPPSLPSSPDLSPDQLDVQSFSSLNDFFIRKLIPGARPIHPPLVKGLVTGKSYFVLL